MTKEAHEAYASGAASALRGMNIPEEVKLAAFQYMTKESASPAAAAVTGAAKAGLSRLHKILLGTGLVGTGAAAGVVGDRYGLPGYLPYNEGYRDAYQARFGQGYEQRLREATAARHREEARALGGDVRNMVAAQERLERREEQQRRADLEAGREARQRREAGEKGAPEQASSSGNITLNKDNLMRNLGYGAATIGGLYGLHRLMS